MTATRVGTTTTVKLGNITLEITVNTDEAGTVREVFGKCDEGYQGELDGMCILASLALQYGCPVETIAKHLRHRNYPPHGGPGQPKSISDAVATVLEPYGEPVDADRNATTSQHLATVLSDNAPSIHESATITDRQKTKGE